MIADGYRGIAADPPWPQKGAGRPLGRASGSYRSWATRVAGPRTRAMPYQLMTVDEIAAMPVDRLAHQDGAHLYLWTTNQFLADAFRVVRAWGFTYSTTLVWAKAPMGGGTGGAYGISTEYIVYARRGKVPAQSRITGTWFRWKRPYDERGKPQHSAKPGEFYDMVETVSPGPRLELFARRDRPGWDVWGNQAPGAVRLEALDVVSVATGSKPSGGETPHAP